MLKNNLFIKSVRLLPAVFLSLVLSQSCTTYHYNPRSRGYIRTPPSTGRNRCGCLLNEKKVDPTEYACIHVQKN